MLCPERVSGHIIKHCQVIQANCPNCGNTVPFHSEFSTHAVCASCDTLVVRRESGVDNLGKVAEIQQDGSPLQLGVQGQYQGRNFQVVGRIQLRYQDGFWNEWHLFYSNGESGWLGEAMGEYFVSFAVAGDNVPAQAQIGLGDALTLQGEPYAVTGAVRNSVSAYEGELPFIVDGEQEFATFDLRSTSGKAATIDFSDDPPTVFIGQYVPFSEFRFTGLRRQGQLPDPGDGIRMPAAQAAVERFNCPTCGAPHSVSGGIRSKVLVCEFCGSAVDLTGSNLQVLWQEAQIRNELQGGSPIPLGSQGTIDGIEFTVIGYLKKSVVYDGVKYPWLEYLLYSFTDGYRWLVESDNHYTLMVNLAEVPEQSNGQPVARPGPQTIRYRGLDYRHFQSSTPRVDALAGEFYWRVRVGDQAPNFDYVAPPYSLSVETSDDSFVWTQGIYKEPGEIQSLFGLQTSLPSPVGVAPAQPNPYVETNKSVWRTFWAFAIAGFLLMATGLLPGGSREVYHTKNATFQTFRENPERTSEPFEIKGHGNVALDFEATNLSERWLFIKATLVNQESKKDYPVGATLESFSGKEVRSARVRLNGLPNGTYTLQWKASSGGRSETADAPSSVASTTLNYSVRVLRGVGVWGWYFFLLLVLIPVPLMMASRKSSFETRRWYNSDYG